MTARAACQPSLPLRARHGHGGARPGAGRPRREGAGVSHAARPALASRFPVHVTLRSVAGGPNLRRGKAWLAVEAALRAATRSAQSASCRIVHFTVESNHLHLVAEARDAVALSRGIQGLSVRIARKVNAASGRKGKLWRDRFHARILRTPREVRNALCYVLQNARRHVDQTCGMVAPGWVDPRSSGRWFDGWSDGGAGRSVEPDAPPGSPDAVADPPPVTPARTWLLATGWRRAGLIGIDEVPAAALRGRRRLPRDMVPVV